ncbi:hypothetical protein NE237_032674 [Protea cynaroides]|uniref:NADH-ubiquinone oxidoreductase chain 4 n=1 Tax=Protea cynaroides TaxID=273540 RepID=A0A9Q0R3P7_9MAGN|nr:hypothetical protein NE237_032674 [Protea cynaroides]
MFRRLRQGQEAIDLALALGQPHNLNLELALAPPMLEDQPASQQVGGEVGPNGEGGNPENPEIERIARRLQIYQSCRSVGWSGMRSYGKEYITAFLIREFLMIAVFRMLDPLLFYVLPESVPIPMLCGAEHLLFAGIKLFLCRGLVQ